MYSTMGRRSFFVLLSSTLTFFWPPPAVCSDESRSECARFVLCPTGRGGLGDQLENYVYCEYSSKVLHAQLVLVPDFTSSTSTQHPGTSEYGDVAALLGVDMSLNETAVKKRNLTEHILSYSEVHQEALARPRACDVLYRTTLYSCPDALWNSNCNFTPKYSQLKHVRWRLLRGDARGQCFSRGLGVMKRDDTKRALSVVWHVRNGDICLHCTVEYFTGLRNRLERVLQKLGRSLHLIFDSEQEPAFIRSVFPNDTYYVSAPLMEAVCRFLTADILITSGSSFPNLVSVFAPPWLPVVLEERRKEADWHDDAAWKAGVFHHIHDSLEAVLLEDGVPLLPDAELEVMLRTVLSRSA